MTKTVSRNSSNVFMSFTAKQLLVLEEILEKEISYYVRNRAFQQFVKDGDLLSIWDGRRNNIIRYQNIGRMRLKAIKAINAINGGWEYKVWFRKKYNVYRLLCRINLLLGYKIDSTYDILAILNSSSFHPLKT